MCSVLKLLKDKGIKAKITIWVYMSISPSLMQSNEVSPDQELSPEFKYLGACTKYLHNMCFIFKHIKITKPGNFSYETK